jgi:hypothetical protein
VKLSAQFAVLQLSFIKECDMSAHYTFFTWLILFSGWIAIAEHESRSNSNRGQARTETIDFGSIPNPKVGTLPIEFKLKDKLVPANRNGNPGFGFSIKSTTHKDSRSDCQATLVNAENGICTAATASHCLYEDVIEAKRNGFDKEVLKKEGCPKEIQQRGALWGELTISMADFGEVKAIGVVNQEYYAKTESEDSAIFNFSCPKGPGSVPVIPISNKTLKLDEEVTYGKVKGDKIGLHPGKVFRELDDFKVNSRMVGEAQESIIQPPEKTIQPGDSGGGVFTKGANGQQELAGVLSTGDDIKKKRPIGKYATNKSLDFVRCLLGVEAQNEENQKDTGAPKSMSELSGEKR